MSRPPRGQDVLDSVLQAIASATTIEQLRQAQAVVLPLQYGMNLEQTAQAIGLSKGWTCRLRNQFIAGSAVGDKGKSVRGGRRREHFTPEREAELLKPFLESASIGGILVVRQNWAKNEPIRLMFQDEARFGRINDVRRCWAPKPLRPLCQAMLTHEYTYTYAAVEVKSGELDSLNLPYINTDCMQLFLDEVGARHPSNKIVMVLDGAGWHSSRLLNPPQNMKLLPLPPYAPELNPVEHVWDELREKYFHNRVFDNLDALEDQLEVALRTFESNAPMVKSIVAWKWIVIALLN